MGCGLRKATIIWLPEDEQHERTMLLAPAPDHTRWIEQNC